MASRAGERTAAERDRRAIRWLIVKVAVFLLVPVIAAGVVVTINLR